ncbi:hypothetical protein F5884DRAFT_885253 [Xylogone sp. PMI_703]|nr:hypothetical protein F5884DRAFT_885253 [Xylogone sp. PMI_703]
MTRQPPLEYWKTYLSGTEPCHFPVLNDGIEGSSSVSEDIRIKSEHLPRYSAFCRQNSISPAALFQVAWGLVLKCYVGIDDVCFGFQEKDAAVDSFRLHNPLVRSFQLGADVALKQVLETIETDYHSSQEHASCKLSDIYKALDLGESTLFNTLINFYKTVPLTGQEGYPALSHTRLIKYPIEVEIFEVQSNATVILRYKPSHFSHGQALNIASAFEKAIACVFLGVQQKQTVGEQDLFSDYHRACIDNWNREANPRLIEECVKDVIQRTIDSQPDDLAVCAWDAEWTYHQVGELANQLAHHLVSLGVGLEVMVLILFEKSAWVVIAMVAILKAGGTMVPLEPAHPALRLKQIAKQTNATILLSCEKHFDVLADSVETVILVNQDLFSNLSLPKDPPLTSARPNNAAFITFTSGSTGTPKGVITENGAYVSSLTALQPLVNNSRGTRILHVTSHGFTPSIMELVGSLMFGSCVCIPRDTDRQADFAGVLNNLRISLLCTTPSVLKPVNPENIQTLKTVLLFGEPMTEDAIRKWSQKVKLCNSWGSTEGGLISYKGDLKLSPDVTNVGRCAGITRIVDPNNHDHQVPIGAVGELIVHSPWLTRGYLNDAEKTASVFIERPEWLKDTKLDYPAKFYKMGDLVRQNSDGTMSFAGRKDTMVKIRGQRLELGEVERNVADDPDIFRSLVVLPTAGLLAEPRRLVAVVSLRKNIDTEQDSPEKRAASKPISVVTGSNLERAAAWVSKFRETLAIKMPIYMVPTVWAIVDEIPLNMSSKIDRLSVRKWLEQIDPETYEQITSLGVGYEAPITPTEKDLEQIWSDVLNLPIEKIGRSRSFLSLGGDSISAMAVVSACRKHRISLAVADLFRSGTIAELALHCQVEGNTDDTNMSINLVYTDLRKTIRERLPEIGIAIDDVEDAYPCSAIQEGLLLSKSRGAQGYNTSAIYEIVSSLEVDSDRLKRAWQNLVDYHACLRTTFVEGLSQISSFDQVVLKSYDVSRGIKWLNDIEVDSRTDIHKILKGHSPEDYGSRPPHELTVLRTKTGKVFCKIDADHTIIDGISMSILICDFRLAYETGLVGAQSVYSSYIGYLFEHQLLTRAAQVDLTYWKGYLANVDPCIFPNLLDTTASLSARTLNSYAINLGDLDLRTYCRAHSVTLSNLFQVVWAIVLGTYTGSEEACFGYLTSGRDVPVSGIQDAVGPFINMLVCRIPLSKEYSLIQLLGQAQSDYLNSLSHQHCPLAEIQHALNLSGGQSLFNTAMTFIVQSAMTEKESTIDFHEIGGSNPTEYDIIVEVDISKSTPAARLTYWTSQLSDADAANLASTFGKVLQCLAIPEQKIGDLDLISERNKTQILNWNAEYPKASDVLFHDLVSQQARRTPHAMAIESWDGNLTYQELESYSTRFAQHLVSLGVGPETLVLLAFEKCLWTTVAMLATLKAGGACVPVDPNHPMQRLEHIMKQTKVKHVLVTPKHEALFRNVVEHIVVFQHSLLSQLPDTSPLPAIASPENAAWVVFTSGSTGQPKGIVLTHMGLSTGLEAFKSIMRVNSGTRVFQFAAYTFDVSIGETFLALISGACLCVPSEHDRMNDLEGILRKTKVSLACLTPTVATMIDANNVPDLKVLVLVGEPVKHQNVSYWAEKVYLINAYGPAETTIWCAFNPGLILTTSPHNIGVAAGSLMWIADPSNPNRLSPIGCVGELLISGPLLARGYLNDKEKTDAAFIENPPWLQSLQDHHDGTSDNDAPSWTKQPMHRLYRSGDLARYYSDGTFRIVGRKDNQIKRFGQRIEPGEIEYQLMQSGTQIQAAAIYDRGGGTLVAFLDFIGHDDQETEEIETHPLQPSEPLRLLMSAVDKKLTQKLPSYMIPSYYVPISNMPLLTSGKLDRTRISTIGRDITKEQLMQYSISSVQKTPPANDMETKLQSLWMDTLKTQDIALIGREDSFFRLGGDSIGAMRLVSRARKAGIRLSVSEVFQNPHLFQLASVATEEVIQRQDVSPYSLLSQQELESTFQLLETQYGIDKSDIENIFPCTPLQEGLILLSMKQEGAYISQNSFSIDNINLVLFQKAWDMVFEKHPILRTRIIHSGLLGSLQVVVKQSISWESSLSLSVYLKAEKQVPMSFGDPLTRYAIVSHNEAKYFVWTIHHSIYDGWSMALIQQEVGRLYHALSSQLAVTLPDAPSYSTFIEYILSTNKESASTFWKDHLSGTPSSFPVLRDQKEASVNSFISHECHLGQTTLPNLTMSTKIRAAWALVLARYAESNNVVFGTTLSGRNAAVPDIERITGPTITTVPIQVAINGDQELSQFLESIQEVAAKMIPFEHIGLQHIQRISPELDRVCSTIQSLLVVQPMPQLDEPEKNSALDQLWHPIKSGNYGSTFFTYPLNVEVLLQQDKVAIMAHFDEDVIPSTQMSRILNQLAHVLQQLHKASPGQCVQDIEVISPQEKLDIISWNENLPTTVEACIHHLFIAKAAQFPLKHAICSWDTEFTYAQLDMYSTILADQLDNLDIGVGQGTMVPLLFEKSAWTIVAMLGVLKAGAAFVPLDPSQPKSRILEIFIEVKCQLILCSPQYATAFKDNIEVLIVIDNSFLDSSLVGGQGMFSDDKGSGSKILIQSGISRNSSTAPSTDYGSVISDPNSLDSFSTISEDSSIKRVGPNSPAYVIFTSGSTGKSKGVVMKHKAYCTQAREHISGFSIEESSRVLNHSSYSFEAFLLETLTVLLAGGTICVVSESTRMSPMALMDAINDMKVSWSFFTPSHIELLHPDQVPTLKSIILGGESMTQNNINTWSPKVQLMNGYGPTETCICSIVNADVQINDDPNDIGCSIGGRCWVVEPDGKHLAPIGCAGELYLEGPTLAVGYLNNEAKTKEVFIENPIWLPSDVSTTNRERRVYKTGDLGRLNENGTFKFIGRIDTQVKIRGNRVELGEVEFRVKSSLVGASNVVVEKVNDYLVAFFSMMNQKSENGSNEDSSNTLLSVFTETLKSSVSNVMETLAETLPVYMIPALYVPLTRMPLSTSGKADRRALQALATNFTVQQLAEYALTTNPKDKRAPSTEIQKQLQQVWAKSLGIPIYQIGLDDNFFRLGGDSLKAMRLAVDAKKAGVTLAVANIFRHPKLVDMAAIATALGEDLLRQLKSNYKIEANVVLDAYPCTPLQESIMILSHRHTGTYMAQYVFKVSARSLGNFKESLQAVVNSHPILRTRIVQVDGGKLFQVVLSSQIAWQFANSLEQHLEEDRKIPMGYGHSLLRFTLIPDTDPEFFNFILTAHNSIHDRWTLSKILGEVRTNYGLNGPKARTSNMLVYKDFVNYIARCNETAAGSFWKAQLSGSTLSTFPKLPSPTYKPVTDRTTRYCIELSAARISLTPFVIQAAWALLLSRYSESSDGVTFGAVLDGRNTMDPQPTFYTGTTLATVPLMIPINAESTVPELLAILEQKSEEIRPFQHFGMQNIQQLGGDASKACEFQTLLAIQTSNFESLGQLPHIAPLVEYPGAVTYPLTLECRVGNGSKIEIISQYDQKIISNTQMHRILRQLEHIMKQLVDSSLDTSKKIGSLKFISPEDEQEIMRLNQNLPPYLDICIHEVIAQHARQRPDAVAVCSLDESLSYLELDTSATYLARYLTTTLGVGPETLVPLLFSKSVWTVVAMVAVLKAGGGYVPLDPFHPLPRLQEICEQIGSSIALCSSQYETLAGALTNNTFVVNESTLKNLKSELESTELSIPVTSQNVAYVQFTSGSTGRPKGVVMSHGGFCTAAKEHGEATNLNKDSRVIHFSSYAFEACILEIMTTLFNGGCVCVAPDERRLEDLPGVMRQLRANWAFFTPSFVRTIRPEDVPDLKTLVLGGEALGNDNIEVWADKVLLINGYGPTETCVFSSLNSNISRGVTTPDMIGSSTGGACWIVEPWDHTKLTPFGCVGELVIESFTLARQYLNDSAKTLLKFTNNPNWLNMSGARSDRIYRTGDLVYYNTSDNATGDLRFVGRVDTQIKIHGQRLELGDIESHIQQGLRVVTHVAVEQVQLRSRNTKVLTAFFCHEDLGGPTDQPTILPISPDLRNQLRSLEKSLTEGLPSYMIPALFVPLSRMPLLPSGKTDRRTLREIISDLSPDAMRDFSLNDTQKRQPDTETETEVCRLWSDILGIATDSIGLDDSFFRLGGDSIAAMRLATLAHDSGLRITVADVFKHPRLQELATKSSEINSRDEKDFSRFTLLGDDTAVASILGQLRKEYDIDANKIEDAFPCTPLQEGLMTLSIKQPGSYVSQSVFSLQLSVNLDRFKKAWSQTVKRNSILRTRLIHTGTRSVQAVTNENHCDISWRTGNSLDAYLNQDANEQMGYGCQLTRYGLIELPSGDRYFVWTAHHAIYDGWSFRLIMKEVESIYRTPEIADSPRSPSYARFIEHLQDIDTHASEQFWLSQLSSKPLSTFPEPRESSKSLVETSITHRVQISRPRGSDITLSTLIRTAWSLVVAEHADSDDIVFGAILMGRNGSVEAIERITGPTITTVPIRVSIDRQKTADELLKAVQDDATSMMPFEHTGLQNIKRLGPEAERACNFQNLLVIQPGGQFDLEGELWRSDDMLAKGEMVLLTYALIVECRLEKDGIEIVAQYRDEVIPTLQMRRILHQFEHIMHQLNTKGSSVVDNIELISHEDREELFMWNHNGVLQQRVDECVHEVIQRQMRTQPLADAVCSWDDNFTYQELDQLSSRLAGHLRGLGVGPEVIVPLCFDKSAWTIVAILGVLRAGGGYVSLDTKHPMARKEHLINRVGATIILTGEPYEDDFLPFGYTVVLVNRVMIEHLPVPDEELNIATTAANTAFIVFTSGSTGVPKAIQMPHGSFYSGSREHSKALNISPTSRVLQFASYVYDVSMGEILTTLMQGGCICVPTEHERMNNLAGVINSMKVNWCFLTPTVAGLLKPKDVPGLQYLVLGGEHATTDNFQSWGAADHVCLINSYGPAECAIWSACAPHRTPEDNTSNLGRPIGSLLWVTSATNPNKLSSIGCVGELLIEGTILARGYLGDERATSAAFIENPSWSVDGSGRTRRMYRTGDLVRQESDGTFSFVGRRDTQIKLRGQRIELGEIEHALARVGPKEWTVVVEMVQAASRDGDATLVAFIRPHDEQSENEGNAVIDMTDTMYKKLETIRGELEDILPPHMVPAHFILTRSIPLTAGGKTDRGQLRTIWHSMSPEQLLPYKVGGAAVQPPTTETERKLRALWARVLGIDEDSIGLDHNFSRIGGDSITAMRLVSAGRAEGISLTVAQIFRYPKLRDMSGVCKLVPLKEDVVKVYESFSTLNGEYSAKHIKHLVLHQNPSLSGLTEVDIEDAFETTDYQSWVLACGSLQTRGYYNYFILRLNGNLDVERLKKACQIFVNHHPILRSIFVSNGHQLLQVILKHVDVEFKIYSSAVEGMDMSIIENDMERPAELGEQIIRFMLVQQGGSHRLMMRISHAQYDGICLSTLIRDIKLAYAGSSLSNTSPRHEFYNLVHSWQRAHGSDAETFWRKTLVGSHMTNIISHSAPPYQNKINQSLQKILPDVASKIKGFTLATIIKAAWSLVLAQFSHQTDIVFGQVVTGRNTPMPGIEDMVGPCMNIIPVRVTLDEDLTFLNLFSHVQDHHLACLQFELFGFRQIIERCTTWPRWTRFSSILQHTNFNLELDEVGTMGEATCQFESFSPPHDVSDMWLWSAPKDNGVWIDLTYSEAIPQQLAEDMFDLLCSVIDKMSNNLEITVRTVEELHASTFQIPLEIQKEPSSQFLELETDVSPGAKLIVKNTWKSILGFGDSRAGIEAETPFFELNGQPIIAAQLASVYRREGITITVEQVIDHPTISSQMHLITKLLQSNGVTNG